MSVLYFAATAISFTRSGGAGGGAASVEFRAGCKTRSELRTLSQFQRPFEQGGRVVTPNHEICCQAGAVLAELGSAFGFEAEKRRRIANDVLIGLSAVSIRAALNTLNRADFTTITRVYPFDLVWLGRRIRRLFGRLTA